MIGRSPGVALRFDAVPVSLARSGDGVMIELETPDGAVVEVADLAVAAVGGLLILRWVGTVAMAAAATTIIDVVVIDLVRSDSIQRRNL